MVTVVTKLCVQIARNMYHQVIIIEHEIIVWRAVQEFNSFICPDFLNEYANCAIQCEK